MIFIPIGFMLLIGIAVTWYEGINARKDMELRRILHENMVDFIKFSATRDSND